MKDFQKNLYKSKVLKRTNSPPLVIRLYFAYSEVQFHLF